MCINSDIGFQPYIKKTLCNSIQVNNKSYDINQMITITDNNTEPNWNQEKQTTLTKW